MLCWVHIFGKDSYSVFSMSFLRMSFAWIPLADSFGNGVGHATQMLVDGLDWRWLLRPF